MSEPEIIRSDKSNEGGGLWPDVAAASLGAIMAILFIVAITIAAELSESLKNGLKDLTGHHWVTKGLLSIGVFLVTAIITHPVFRKRPKELMRWGFIVAAVALVGAVVLFLFFVGHYVGQ